MAWKIGRKMLNKKHRLCEHTHLTLKIILCWCCYTVCPKAEDYKNIYKQQTMNTNFAIFCATMRSKWRKEEEINKNNEMISWVCVQEVNVLSFSNDFVALHWQSLWFIQFVCIVDGVWLGCVNAELCEFLCSVYLRVGNWQQVYI